MYLAVQKSLPYVLLLLEIFQSADQIKIRLAINQKFQVTYLDQLAHAKIFLLTLA